MSTIGEIQKKIRINVIHEPALVSMTPRKQDICLSFGIPPREEPRAIVEDLDVSLGAGRIMAICGPSGSGKTSVLRRIAEQFPSALWVGRPCFPTDRPLIDAISPRREVSVALELLTACGLGEPRLWIRRYCDLSDGEKIRAAMARAIGMALTRRERPPIFCDEFTTLLHRRAARAISHNLRKLVTRHLLTLIVATHQDDILQDLQPDQLLRLGELSPQLVNFTPSPAPASLHQQVVIEPGSVRDYHRFGPMHYRLRDNLGFVDKVFLLREAPGGDPLGILVFAHAPRELALRNHATKGRFIRNMRRLNGELRILRRLVMHPDVRGCGLGHWFVKNTLPQVGVRFVECLAVMGSINPVFEKAGMTRIGRCQLPQGRMKLLQRMRDMKLDPFATDFDQRIARYPRVRTLVKKTIQDWVISMQSGSQYDVKFRSAAELARAFLQVIGEPPMYYLWDRENEFPIRETGNQQEVGPSQRDPSRKNPHRKPRVDTREEKDRHRPDNDAQQRNRTRDRSRRT